MINIAIIKFTTANFPFVLRKSDAEAINTGIIKKKFSPEYAYRPFLFF